LLWLQRRHPGQPAFDATGAGRTLRAHAPVAPPPPGTDRPLSRLMGRLDASDLPTRPQGLAALEDVPTRPGSLGHSAATPRSQEPFHGAAQWAPIRAKGRALARTRAHPMPPGTQLVGRRQHGLTHCLCAASTGAHRFAIPEQRRPAQLTPPPRLPVVGTGAVRHQDARKRLPPRVTAPHNPARLPPGRPLVSSRWATAGSCTSGRASSPGAALAAVVACAPWLSVPTLIGPPPTSSIACWVVRLEKRYAPVHNATVAWMPGPSVPLGPPAGQGARVTSPQAGHPNWGHCYAVPTGWLGGSARTWCRHGVGSSPRQGASQGLPCSGLRPPPPALRPQGSGGA